MIEGHFVALGEGRVFKEYQPSEDEPPDTFDSLHFALDFNYNACCSTGWIVAKPERGASKQPKQMYAIEEHVHKDTESFCKSIRARYPNEKVYVYPDSTGQSNSTNSTETDVAILRKYRFLVIAGKTNPGIQDSINCCNVALHASVIHVSPRRTPRLSAALLEHQYKNEKPEKFQQHPSIDDWTDGFRYIVSAIFPIRDANAGTYAIGFNR